MNHEGYFYAKFYKMHKKTTTSNTQRRQLNTLKPSRSPLNLEPRAYSPKNHTPDTMSSRFRKKADEIDAVLKDLNSRNIRSDLVHDVILIIDGDKIKTQIAKRNEFFNKAARSSETERLIVYDYVFVEKIEVANQVRLMVIKSLYSLGTKGLSPQNAIQYRTMTEYGFKLKYEWDATRAYILEHRKFDQWSKPAVIEFGKKKNCYLKSRFGMDNIPKDLEDMLEEDNATFGKLVDAYKNMHEMLNGIDLNGNVCVIALLTERDFETGEYSNKIVCEFVSVDSSFLNFKSSSEETAPTILIEFRRRRVVTEGFVVMNNEFLWKYSSQDRNDCGFRLWTLKIEDPDMDSISSRGLGLITRPDIQLPLRKEKNVFELCKCDFNVGSGSNVDTGKIHKEGVYVYHEHKENGLGGLIEDLLDLGINSTRFIQSVLKLTFQDGIVSAKCDMFINKTMTSERVTPLFRLVIAYDGGADSFLPIYQFSLGDRAKTMAASYNTGRSHQLRDSGFDVLDYQSQIMIQLKNRYKDNIRNSGVKDTRARWLCWLHKHWNKEAEAVNFLQSYDRLVSISEDRNTFQWSNGVKRISTENSILDDDVQ